MEKTNQKKLLHAMQTLHKEIANSIIKFVRKAINDARIDEAEATAQLLEALISITGKCVGNGLTVVADRAQFEEGLEKAFNSFKIAATSSWEAHKQQIQSIIVAETSKEIQ